MKFAIVGAGFTGSVLAFKLAKAGLNVDVYDSREHVAGNCYSERDDKTGIMVHKYGPHIFHTDNQEVWQFINQFSELVPYVNRVKVTANNQVFSLPINLLTINQLFKKTFNPKEAMNFFDTLSEGSIDTPKTFEEQALKYLGREIYETFFKGYTTKQWGVSPAELPASILKRLPIRFTYDDNYFSHRYQGMPKDGYTIIIEKMLNQENIVVKLNEKFFAHQASEYKHVFYTGPIDEWFDCKKGRLGYRTLDFKKEIYDYDYQGCAVMNYADSDVPYTRISEHNYFSPWENHKQSIIFKEYSRKCEVDDIPYYPLRLVGEKALLETYIELAKKQKKVSFLGRLGTYRYLDMDKTIEEALCASEIILENIASGVTIPVFFNNPL